MEEFLSMLRGAGKSTEERIAAGILTTPEDITKAMNDNRLSVELRPYMHLSRNNPGLAVGDYVTLKEGAMFAVPSKERPGRILDIVMGREGYLNNTPVGLECRVLVLGKNDANIFSLPIAALQKTSNFPGELRDRLAVLYGRYLSHRRFYVNSLVHFAPYCATNSDMIGSLGIVLQQINSVRKPFNVTHKNHGEVRDLLVGFYMEGVMLQTCVASWRLDPYVAPSEEEIAAARAVLEKAKEQAGGRKRQHSDSNPTLNEENGDSAAKNDGAEEHTNKVAKTSSSQETQTE